MKSSVNFGSGDVVNVEKLQIAVRRFQAIDFSQFNSYIKDINAGSIAKLNEALMASFKAITTKELLKPLELDTTSISKIVASIGKIDFAELHKKQILDMSDTFKRLSSTIITVNQLKYTQISQNVTTISTIDLLSVDMSTNTLSVDNKILSTSVSGNGEYALIRKRDLELLLSAKTKSDIALAQRYINKNTAQSPNLILKDAIFHSDTYTLKIGDCEIGFSKASNEKVTRGTDILTMLFKNRTSKKDGIELEELYEYITGHKPMKIDIDSYKAKACQWVGNLNAKISKATNGKVQNFVIYNAGEKLIRLNPH